MPPALLQQTAPIAPDFGRPHASSWQSKTDRGLGAVCDDYAQAKLASARTPRTALHPHAHTWVALSAVSWTPEAPLLASVRLYRPFSFHIDLVSRLLIREACSICSRTMGSRT